MNRTHRLPSLILLCCMTTGLILSGCAGPMKLKRGLDEIHNQFYIDTPAVAEVTLPFFFVGDVAAGAVDIMLINPVFWWKDALRGHGTPYYYRNPTAAEVR